MQDLIKGELDWHNKVNSNFKEVDLHMDDMALHGSNFAKQALINGNFDIWQRGTSFNYSTTAYDSKYTADRWVVTTTPDGGTNPNITASKLVLNSGEILNSSNAIRLAWDGVGASLGNNAYLMIQQKIEFGTRFLCGLGKKVTLAFKVRSSIAGKKIAITIAQNYGTGGTPSPAEQFVNNEVVIQNANVWQDVTFTLDTNTLLGKTFGSNNNDFLNFTIFLEYGSGMLIGTGESFRSSGNIDIGQARVYSGDSVLPFTPISIDDELRMCQRYCKDLFGFYPFSYVQDVNTLRFMISMVTSDMRLQSPTLVNNGIFNIDWNVFTSSNATSIGGTVSLVGISDGGAGLTVTKTSHGITGNTVFLAINNKQKIFLDAEL